MEGGDKIPVTSDNKHDFVAKYVDYVLNTSISKQVRQHPGLSLIFLLRFISNPTRFVAANLGA